MTADFRALINENPPAFSEAEFQPAPWPEDAGRFFSGKLTEDCAAVDLSRVRYTRDSRFRGFSWREVLESSELDEVLVELSENPGYYVSGGLKIPAPEYVSLDRGTSWAVEDGLKRTVAGRFFLVKSGYPPVLYGVRRILYIPDEALERLWPELTAYYPTLCHSGYTVEAVRHTMERVREDWHPGFTLDGGTLDRAAVLALPRTPTTKSRWEFWR